MEILTTEKLYNISEYLEAEDQSLTKNEFYNGNIVPVSGASFIHNIIAVNILTCLKNTLKKKQGKYYVSNSDTKIHVPFLESFVYPDAVVVSKLPAFYQQRTDTITNPLLVVEVLSPRTAKYDNQLKFEEYCTIPSFRQYVLVSQDQPYVSTFYREEEELWRRTNVRGSDEQLYLASLDITLKLSDIYEDIDLLGKKKRK
ncbi:MAG: Uma2 family endonuclease [Bacteroidota bacterium]